MATIVLPKISDYGAAELKDVISNNTKNSFLWTVAVATILFLLNWVYAEFLAPKEIPLIQAPIVSIDISDLPPITDQNDKQENLPPPPPTPTVVTGGPAARAGTPIPIPDAEIAPDLQEFADMEVMDRASAEGGDGVDLGNFSENIDFNNSGLEVNIKEEEPDPNEFQAVEVEPGFDIAKLQGMIVYPEIAKRSGIEGRVIVKALVDKDGSIKKTLIEYSDNARLDQAALDAIKKYGNFNPAIQNNQPVMCWVTVPLRFQLR